MPTLGNGLFKIVLGHSPECLDCGVLALSQALHCSGEEWNTRAEADTPAPLLPSLPYLSSLSVVLQNIYPVLSRLNTVRRYA